MFYFPTLTLHSTHTHSHSFAMLIVSRLTPCLVKYSKSHFFQTKFPLLSQALLSSLLSSPPFPWNLQPTYLSNTMFIIPSPLLMYSLSPFGGFLTPPPPFRGFPPSLSHLLLSSLFLQFQCFPLQSRNRIKGGILHSQIQTEWCCLTAIKCVWVFFSQCRNSNCTVL